MKTLDSQQIHQGRVISLHIETFELDDGRVVKREIVHHPGAVAVVAVTDDNQIVLVRQSRPATGEKLLEIPAGTLEAGEDPLECAKRELIEETSFSAESIKQYLFTWLAPGYSDEKMYYFLARGLHACEGQLDEDEDVEVELLAVGSIQEAIQDGRVTDAKTVAGLLAALPLI